MESGSAFIASATSHNQANKPFVEIATLLWIIVICHSVCGNALICHWVIVIDKIQSVNQISGNASTEFYTPMSKFNGRLLFLANFFFFKSQGSALINLPDAQNDTSLSPDPRFLVLWCGNMCPREKLKK